MDMKIIFLDNDGVICLSENWGSRFKKARKHMIDNNISEYAFADENDLFQNGWKQLMLKVIYLLKIMVFGQIQL